MQLDISIFPLLDLGESQVQTKFRPILNPGCWYTPNSLGLVLVQTQFVGIPISIQNYHFQYYPSLLNLGFIASKNHF